MPEHFLIVGGGAVGMTSAQALLLAGHRVTLIERNTTGLEASWAGGGIMSPLCSWDYPESVTRLTQHSMGLFPDAMAALQRNTGIDPEYKMSGMLLIPPFDNQRAASWCKQHEVPLHSVKLGDYLHGMEGCGLLLPKIGQVRNPRLLAALRRHIEMLGVNLLEQQQAQQFEILGDRIVGLRTSKGLVSADQYIVAAGAWSRTLLGDLALNLNIKPIRGQILLFKFEKMPFEQILLQQNLYFIPRGDGHVLVGSTLEDAGFDKSTTEEARRDLLLKIRALFPDWPQPVMHWAGLRPASADNIPTLGRHPHLQNLYANCGHFRYGVTMSPACAQILLNCIENRTQPFPVEEYRWRE